MSNNPFAVDKEELLEAVLEHYDTDYNRNKRGEQIVRCFNPDGHAHGDRTPSLGINLTKGMVNCYACDLKGDGFNIMMELEGWKAVEVLEKFGMQSGREISEWLI